MANRRWIDSSSAFGAWGETEKTGWPQTKGALWRIECAFSLCFLVLGFYAGVILCKNPALGQGKNVFLQIMKNRIFYTTLGLLGLLFCNPAGASPVTPGQATGLPSMALELPKAEGDWEKASLLEGTEPGQPETSALSDQLAPFAPVNQVASLLAPLLASGLELRVEAEQATDGEFGDLDDEFGAPQKEVNDPLAGYNRTMTGFNDWVFLWLLNPVAKGWKAVVPEGGRTAIFRFFKNLLYPLRLVNNLLQVKLGGAVEETGRFAVNSTIGLLGLFDPAQAWFGWEAHDEDFGQTLGYWGVGPGPHIVLPFLGPSNLRDTFALAPDWALDPITYYANGYPQQIGIWTFKSVNSTSLDIGGYESLKKDAVDFYPFLRDVYEQNRKKKIEE